MLGARLSTKEIYQSPMSTMKFVDSFLRDLGNVQKKQSVQQKSAKATETAARWVPPPSGSYKINVDVAVAKTANMGAVGAVCRSDQGLYLGAAAMVFEGITQPAILEALACREGLALLAE
jgi:hypothetical protein